MLKIIKNLVAAAVVVSGLLFVVAVQAAAPVIAGADGLNIAANGDRSTDKTQATAGQYLILYGTFASSGNTVTINGDNIAPDFQSAKQINIPLGQNPTGNVDIVVKNSEGASNTYTFKIVPATTLPTGNPPVATGSSAGCNQLNQNFSKFGGGTPGPLLNNCFSPGQAVARAVRLAFTLVALLAVLFIVIGGYRYMTSNGDEKQAGTGKQTILWASIGLVLVLLAYTIVTVVTRLTTTSQLF